MILFHNDYYINEQTCILGIYMYLRCILAIDKKSDEPFNNKDLLEKAKEITELRRKRLKRKFGDPISKGSTTENDTSNIDVIEVTHNALLWEM